jgi:protein ImuB
MLWIACHLPRLPLELFASPTPEPFAVAEGRLIAACDKKALARGVRPGMTVAAAHAIAPRLRVRPRDAAGETEALLTLAAWCGQFTPNVALEFPATVLLEVSASLTLFKGLAPMLAALRSGFGEMHYSAQIACARTPLAAAWLARAALADDLDAAVAMQDVLAGLPVALLANVNGVTGVAGAQADWSDAFEKMGISTIGALLAQPRAELAQRFGHALCERLDQALGNSPDLRIWTVPPEHFAANLELPAEVSQAGALLFAARRLLLQLGGFLQARASGVQRFSLRLAHRERATDIVIGLVAPSRDAEHFTLLLRERLAATNLAEPVRAIRLEATDIQPLSGVSQALFAGEAGEQGDWQRLVERLRARLGGDSVSGLALAPEHRPERASVAAEPGTKQPGLRFGDRPLWLLPEPRPLHEAGAAPQHEGPLALIAGPERIESGWWDDAGVKRDYFVARTQALSYVWIYRERQPAGRWYLHGLFA